jgi:hypothetical protein
MFGRSGIQMRVTFEIRDRFERESGSGRLRELKEGARGERGEREREEREIERSTKKNPE